MNLDLSNISFKFHALESCHKQRIQIDSWMGNKRIQTKYYVATNALKASNIMHVNQTAVGFFSINSVANPNKEKIYISQRFHLQNNVS